MYTVVIDESGDVGLKNVKADPSEGPTQYFCMCAAFFSEQNRPFLEKALEPFLDKKGRIHTKDMNHYEKVHLCRSVAKLPIAMVGVLSNKLTLLEYLSEAQKSPTHYYNKVAQYLFERIGDSIAKFGLPGQQVKYSIEARTQQYSSLISFLHRIQRNPLDKRALPIRNIDRFSISAVKKKDDLLISLADIGAHSMFLALRRDPKTYALNETRYLKELQPVFVASQNGRILPAGLKPIHSVKDLGTDSETEKELLGLRNQNREFQRI